MFPFAATCRMIFGGVLLALAFTSSARGENEIFRVTNVQSDDSLNIRQTPSSDAPVTGTIPWNGAQILRIGECQEWCRIRYEGVEGWVNRYYLTADNAATTAMTTKAGETAGSKRFALVIGNSAYQNIAVLTNPINDATDIAAKLRTLQFDVLLGTNVDRAKMRALLNEFKAKVTREHVALVFYAGHGVTVNRESFLLPVDTPAAIELDDNGELRGDAANRVMISMASVLAPLEVSKIGIVFLDACRNNATEAGLGMTARVVSLSGQQTRSVPVVRGTGSLEAKPSPYSAGVFRAYATQINNVASDGAGRNSPFTKALLKHIGTKEISIQDLMIRVRQSVMNETKNEQIPWEEAALKAPFSFSADERWLRPAGRGGTCPGPDGLKRGMTCIDASGRTCRSVSGERRCE